MPNLSFAGNQAWRNSHNLSQPVSFMAGPERSIVETAVQKIISVRHAEA